jgi:hypothetical protein
VHVRWKIPSERAHPKLSNQYPYRYVHDTGTWSKIQRKKNSRISPISQWKIEKMETHTKKLANQECNI